MLEIKLNSAHNNPLAAKKINELNDGLECGTNKITSISDVV